MTSPRSAQEIVDLQVKKWTTMTQVGPRASAQPISPVITISRQYGAQGAAVGKLLCDALGFEFWDRALVHRVAEDAGATERMIETVDEQRRNSFGLLLGGFVGRGSVTSGDYFRRLARVVHTVAAHGSAVLVGRGAQFLAGDDEALHVRVVAPVAHRSAGLCRRHGIDPKQARSEMKVIDAERAKFIKQSFGRDVADPTNYDVIVNTKGLPIDRAAEVIVAAYRAKFPLGAATR